MYRCSRISRVQHRASRDHRTSKKQRATSNGQRATRREQSRVGSVEFLPFFWILLGSSGLPFWVAFLGSFWVIFGSCSGFTNERLDEQSSRKRPCCARNLLHTIAWHRPRLAEIVAPPSYRPSGLVNVPMHVQVHAHITSASARREQRASNEQRAVSNERSRAERTSFSWFF